MRLEVFYFQLVTFNIVVGVGLSLLYYDQCITDGVYMCVSVANTYGTGSRTWQLHTSSAVVAVMPRIRCSALCCRSKSPCAEVDDGLLILK